MIHFCNIRWSYFQGICYELESCANRYGLLVYISCPNFKEDGTVFKATSRIRDFANYEGFFSHLSAKWWNLRCITYLYVCVTQQTHYYWNCKNIAIISYLTELPLLNNFLGLDIFFNLFSILLQCTDRFYHINPLRLSSICIY